MHLRFVETANSGRLRSGQWACTGPIPSSFFKNVYLQDIALPALLRRVAPGSPDLRNPSQRVAEAFGSNTNRSPLLLTHREINAAKGQLFILKPPITATRFATLVGTSLTNADAVEQLMQELRTVRKDFSQSLLWSSQLCPLTTAFTSVADHCCILVSPRRQRPGSLRTSSG